MTILPIAAASTIGLLPILASLLAAAAVSVVSWLVWRVVGSDDLRQGDQWRYDVSRVNELRRLEPSYRILQPAIAPLARLNRAAFGRKLDAIQREIQAAGLPRFWLAEEYLARAEILALALSPVYVYVLFDWMGSPGVPTAGAAVLLTVWFLRHRLASRARGRLRDIKRRMPFLLDLLTLLMEAGSTFLNALRQAVDEFRDHPVGEEFGRVLGDMNLGKTRAEAFTAMRDRLADDEITSILGSILQGEQLGTPLANIFRTQSDVLRIKRTQRAEAKAGEAGVNMLLPGVLVMMATVIVIVGPFLMNYLALGAML